MSAALVRPLVLAAVVASLLGARGAAQTPGDEPVPTLTASALLDASQRSGPHFTVAEAVETPGFYHQFTITSDFGTFNADGRSQVVVRLNEIAALAALQDVSKTGVFLAAAGNSLVNVGTGVVNAVTSPVDTAKGIGSGIKRFGINLGRRSKRAIDEMTDEEKKAEDEASKGNAAANVAKAVLGVNSAMRRWAQKVGADPYTTNPTLRQALEGVAKVDAAGGIATKLVVPIPAFVGTTADIGNLVWGKDPEELRKINEQRARDIGVGEVAAKALWLSNAYTLTMQTRLIAALHAVRVPGCADYVASAVEASTDREALFFIEGAEMLQAAHAESRVTSILADSRTVVARRPSGEVVALLPLDWVRYSDTGAATLREMATRAKEELGATSLRLRVSGQVSERAQREYATLRWTQ